VIRVNWVVTYNVRDKHEERLFLSFETAKIFYNDKIKEYVDIDKLSETFSTWGSDAEESDYETEALEIIEQIYESPAVLAMLQLQDVLMLGEEARMNVPGISEGNWTWKAAGSSIEEAFPDAVERAEWLSDLSQKTGRLAR
jgi:4-alpha-glucanotransferase